MKQSTYKTVAIIVSCIVLSLLVGCGKSKKVDLSSYLGNTLEYFISSTKLEVSYNKEGYYEDEAKRIQVMLHDNKINEIIMYDTIEGYTLNSLSVGVNKKFVEKTIKKEFTLKPEILNEEETQWTSYQYQGEHFELEVWYNKEDNVCKLSKKLTEDTSDNKSTKTNNSTPIDPSQVIVKVGDETVSYSEAFVYLKTAQKLYESEYGNEVWSYDLYGNGTTLGALLKQEVMSQIIQLKIICSEAKKQEITLSDDEILQVRDFASDFMESTSKEEQLEYGITLELATQVFADNMLAEKVYETVTIDINTDVSDKEAKQIKLWKILVKTYGEDSKGNRTDLTEKEAKEVKERVNDIYKQAKETSDFWAFAQGKTEDDRVEYVVGYKELPSELEDVAFSLKADEMSKVIKTEDGYVILYCADDYDEDATRQMKEKIIEERRSELFITLYETWSNSYGVKINTKEWSKIELSPVD